MYTDQELNELNKKVYHVDPKYNTASEVYVAKPDSELKNNETNIVTAGGKDFKVVASADIDNNGYQGFAVAPITKEYPQGDPNNVAIISAGTTPPSPIGEGSDGLTDFFTAFTSKATNNGGSLQTGQADDFVDFVINKKGYNVTQLSGYSQAAYMLKIGAKYKIPTTVFNGWFLYDSLNEDEKKFMMEHPELFRNYRKLDDSTVKLLDGNDRNKLMDLGTIFWFEGDSHGIKDWTFDKNGNVVFGKSDNPNVKMSEIACQASLDKLALLQLRKRLSSSGGGLSSNEEIYLDDSEALLAVETASRMSKTILDSIRKNYQDAITEAEQLWQTTEQAAQNIGTTLSHGEIMSALESGGATQQTIVTTPVSQYQEKISELESQTAEYETLISTIKSSIAMLVASDQELASQIQG
ncbi:hypothetical protein I6N96_07980 [Enterococcus sp. BWM-S5]|uniref:Uncharacterized protein n=1 Tax=Enterococcus larvae TaxID=2794352 RepID=A0ABS4CIE9_9ENTE|nr:hypothetical protein [Enterococcus larvae]MBP1046220.1 hypothetical protein [Enterococcus larvae]